MQKLYVISATFLSVYLVYASSGLPKNVRALLIMGQSWWFCVVVVDQSGSNEETSQQPQLFASLAFEAGREVVEQWLPEQHFLISSPPPPPTRQLFALVYSEGCGLKGEEGSLSTSFQVLPFSTDNCCKIDSRLYGHTPIFIYEKRRRTTHDDPSDRFGCVLRKGLSSARRSLSLPSSFSPGILKRQRIFTRVSDGVKTKGGEDAA